MFFELTDLDSCRSDSKSSAPDVTGVWSARSINSTILWLQQNINRRAVRCDRPELWLQRTK